MFKRIAKRTVRTLLAAAMVVAVPIGVRDCWPDDSDERGVLTDADGEYTLIMEEL